MQAPTWYLWMLSGIWGVNSERTLAVEQLELLWSSRVPGPLPASAQQCSCLLGCSAPRVLNGEVEAAEDGVRVDSELACAQVLFLPCVYALGYVVLAKACPSGK